MNKVNTIDDLFEQANEEINKKFDVPEVVRGNSKAKITPINLSPSFLARMYEQGYDYAVGEKLGLIKKDSQAMSDGRLIHELLAERLGGEPVKFAVNPYDSFRTKLAREWRDAIPDDTAIVSQEKIEEMSKVVDRVLDHPVIKEYFKGEITPEVTIEKKVEGYNIKGILDVVVKGEITTAVYDWKFINSRSFDKFTREAIYSNYDLQASVYDYLSEANNVYFVAIESEVPHRIKVYHCDPSFLEHGADKFNKVLKIIKEANWRAPNFDIPEVGELTDWGSMQA